MSTYEPGTVAVATVRGVPNVRVMRQQESWGPVWTSVAPMTIGEFFRHYEKDVTDIRPLVVLDIPIDVIPHKMAEALRKYDFLWLADQIEQQTKPARIPEPGLWGVVEARVGPDGRYKFVRFNDSSWMCTADSSTYPWAKLFDPTLVRPGIEDGAS